jgi:hypothetical protein
LAERRKLVDDCTVGPTPRRLIFILIFVRHKIVNDLGEKTWKILLKELDEDGYGIKNMAYPSVYNLIVDPKEEVPELNYLNDTWVDFPLYQVLEDHEYSLENDQGSPGP